VLRLSIRAPARFSLLDDGLIPPPSRPSSSFNRSYPHRPLRLFAPASRPYPRRPKSEGATSIHHTLPILLRLSRLAWPIRLRDLTITASYRSSLQPHRSPVWALCRTHPARSRQQAATRKRGAVCTAKVCVSRLQCPAQAPNCCILGHNPISAGLQSVLRLSLRSAQPSAFASGQTFISTVAHDRVLHLL
jgi:hypothetical protein